MRGGQGRPASGWGLADAGMRRSSSPRRRSMSIGFGSTAVNVHFSSSSRPGSQAWPVIRMIGTEDIGTGATAAGAAIELGIDRSVTTTRPAVVAADQGLGSGARDRCSDDEFLNSSSSLLEARLVIVHEEDVRFHARRHGGRPVQQRNNAHHGGLLNEGFDRRWGRCATFDQWGRCATAARTTEVAATAGSNSSA